MNRPHMVKETLCDKEDASYHRLPCINCQYKDWSEQTETDAARGDSVPAQEVKWELIHLD